MANLEVSGSLGTSGNNLEFVSQSRIWAGGTSTFNFTGGGALNANNAMQIPTGTTIEGRNCTIYTTSLGVHNTNGGFLILDSSRIDYDTERGVSANVSSGISLIFNDVEITQNDTDYIARGVWTAPAITTQIPVYQWDNVRFYGEVDTTNFLVGLSPFAGNLIHELEIGGTLYSTRFNNVRYWNGESLASGNCRGASPQLTTVGAHNNPILGPFGADLASGGHRSMIRFSNQGTAVTDFQRVSDHWTPVTNMDYRSIYQVTTGTPDQRLYLGADNGAHVAYINPLQGAQGNTNGQVFVSQFINPAVPAEDNAQQDLLVGSNPVTTDNGQHRYTVTDEAIVTTGTNADARGVVLLPATWDPASPPDYITDTIIHELPNGIMWRQASFNPGATTGLGNQLPIPALSSESYRKYSWFQQPSNDTWGREITVSVPPVVDSQARWDTRAADLATARAGGFDEHNGVSWVTSTNVDDEADNIIIESAHAIVAEAIDATNRGAASGGCEDGADLVASMKGNAYRAATNVRVPLPYSVSDSSVVVDRSLVLDSRFNTDYAIDADSITLAVVPGGVTSTVLVTNITATGSMDLTNAGLDTATGGDVSYTATTSMDFGDNNAIGTFTAATLENIPHTVPAGMVLNGTYTADSDATLTIVDSDDIAGMNLVADLGTTVTVLGAVEADFASVQGNVIFPLTINITFPRAGNALVYNTATGRQGFLDVDLTIPGTQVVRAVDENSPISLSTTVDLRPDDPLLIFYKATNAIVDGSRDASEFFSTTVETTTISAIATGGGSTRVPVIPIPNVLATAVPLPGTLETSTATVSTSTPPVMVIRYNSSLDHTADQSRRLFLEIADTAPYLEVNARRRAAGFTATLNDFIVMGEGDVQVNGEYIDLEEGLGNTRQVTLVGARNVGGAGSAVAGELGVVGGISIPAFLLQPAPTGATSDEIAEIMSDTLLASDVDNILNWIARGESSKIPVGRTYDPNTIY